MESLIGNDLDADERHLNNHDIYSLTPEPPIRPILEKLFLQEDHSLTMVPPSFFEHTPALQVLDLSRTSIQSVPPSISKLCLLEEFILRECSLLTEVPPEIGALKNLKLFDLEGTEIMYLPKEVGRLETLECLRVTLSAYADDYKDRNGIEHIIPRMTISKFTKLKELSISVHPEAEWWETEVLEAIMVDLLVLPDLKTLKLYFPTVKVLQQFLKLKRHQVPIYSSLWDFRLTFGHCEQLTSCLQLDVEENFEKMEKCLKYIDGEGGTDEIAELIRNARALYLHRHWTIEKLSIFDISRLKYCLLMECNEMQTLVHQEGLNEEKNTITNHGAEAILGSLQYLAIHFMKKLQRIWKGPICKKSLSCLRILALHTCPELTSIFSGCLLDNLQSLTELIVEDCPKVNSLITLEEVTLWRKGPFLPNLRRVTLLDLPELVSISSGVCIAPQLHTLLIFNCMKLDYLSVMELPRDVKEIKGEIEWWDGLKYGKLTWNVVFVQLKRDGDLMDQLAEDTNSLQHFHGLQLIPPHPKNVPSFNETHKTSTHKVLNFDNDIQSQYAGTAFRMWEPPCPLRERPHNEDTLCDFKDPNHKDASTKKKSSSTNIAKWIQLVKGSPQIGLEVPPDDGYIWKKYGRMENRNCKHPSKQVQRSDGDPSIFEITCEGEHTYSEVLRSEDFSIATESAFRITDNSFEHADWPKVLDTTKKKRSSTSVAMWKEQVKVSQGIEIELPLDDGYIWRKYGQKHILNAKYPRGYYGCSFRRTHGCQAKKQVQRSTDDPSVFEVTYFRKHTCPTILSNSCSSFATESTCRSLRTGDLSTTTESASTIIDSHSELANRPQVLESTKKKSSSTGNAKWTQQLKVIIETGLDVLPDDGYSWRKYGQKKLSDNKYYSYYKCTKCSVKKRVQRSDDDPSTLGITYEGVHTCLRLSRTSNSSTAFESALRILKASDSLATTESASTITDNSFELNSTNNASIQRLKQQANDIQSSLSSPSFHFQLPSSTIKAKPNMTISEVVENSSRNSSSTKAPQNEKQSPLPASKARKEKLGDKITALQQLVSPFGKADTTSVLLETCCHIKFLHDQVRVLISPYTKEGTSKGQQQQTPMQNLRSQGLCLVPVSSTFPITNQLNVDFQIPDSLERSNTLDSLSPPFLENFNTLGFSTPASWEHSGTLDFPSPHLLDDFPSPHFLEHTDESE